MGATKVAYAKNVFNEWRNSFLKIFQAVDNKDHFGLV